MELATDQVKILLVMVTVSFRCLHCIGTFCSKDPFTVTQISNFGFQPLKILEDGCTRIKLVYNMCIHLHTVEYFSGLYLIMHL